MRNDNQGIPNRIAIRRLRANPIIHAGLDGSLGANINGPSLIRVPEWLDNALGYYYLYFAHHRGQYIRLAYADHLERPWRIHRPGTLQLAQTALLDHIASPDVHVDHQNHQIRMYFHGVVPTLATGGPKQLVSVPGVVEQRSMVATSRDGLHFSAYPEVLGNPYFRVFRWGDYYYALAMPGIFYRSHNGLTHFEEGPRLFSDNMRHSALRIVGSQLQVFFSNVGDSPERILLSTIELDTDWRTWRASQPVTVVEPKMDYEGVDLPLEPSQRGLATRRVRQLRDPAVFKEGSSTYLLFSVAGETGIAIAELLDE